jgi:3-oxoacyl-[acyl-carrier-protein] synthase-3
MYAGAEKLGDGSLRGWAEQTPAEWASHSTFSLKQDVRILNETIARLGARAYLQVLDKRHLRPEQVDFFLPHLSSAFFRPRIEEEMAKTGQAIPSDKWFVNLTRVGNVGSASIFLALEELFHSGRLQKGQKILLAVPESARFSYGYALLTVV